MGHKGKYRGGGHVGNHELLEGGKKAIRWARDLPNLRRRGEGPRGAIPGFCSMRQRCANQLVDAR